MASLDDRVSIVETHIDHIRADIEDIRRRLERIETRMDGLEGRMSSMEVRLTAKLDGHFRWIVGIQITTLLALIGILATKL